MPADKLTTLASRALALWRVVRLFRDVAHRGAPATAEHLKEQTTRILDALDPVTRMVSEFKDPEYVAKISSEITGAATAAAESAVEKTSIVLGHSILDDVLSECCRISAERRPQDWLGYVQGRKITLGELLQKPVAELTQELVSKYVDQLSRESLRTRFEILNRLYQPAPPFTYDEQLYKFDPERVEAIDRHRQGIIHRLELSRQANPNEEHDLLYLEATCFYFINLVAAHHGIAIDPERDAVDALASNADAPLQLAYDGFLLATSLPSSDEDLWIFGSHVYASNGRKSRQLPFLMRAATPDLSSDQQRIVFVKHRRRPEDQEAEDRHAYVGDIWVSAIDGSAPKLVLEGGPRLDLVPPRDGFPHELEGITSPKFDPDGRLVYFIADAWTTSGAIYVLDLETRNVKFFAAGNVLAVLHGEPHRGFLLINQHRYFKAPDHGSYDHFWLVSSAGEIGGDLGPDFDAALDKLYGPNGRERAFPHLRVNALRKPAQE